MTETFWDMEDMEKTMGKINKLWAIDSKFEESISKMMSLESSIPSIEKLVK